MKKNTFSLTLLLGIVALATTGLVWWNFNAKPVSADETSVSFVVTKGKSASQVGQLLYEKGLIRSPLAFKIYVQVTNKADKIQAGEFELNKKMGISEIVETFSEGPLELWVTIPEGLRREEVADKITSSLEMSADTSVVFRQEFLNLTPSLEGFLFPNTYLFPRDVKADVVVNNMKSLFDSQTSGFNGLLDNGKTKEGLTLDEILVLASIIERETKTDEERPIVAGIYLNRLEVGMALQADASVQYAIANINCRNKTSCNWWPILTKTDLEIDSPYNSYKYAGLPPTPIANPGISSIKAIFEPERTDYFYYIHDTNGKIHYARNLDEHNDNVREYLGK